MATTTTTKSETKTRKAPARKAGGPRKAARKADPATGAEPKIVGTIEPATGTEALRRNELVDLVVAKSGGKKKDVKPTVEAMLAVLGELLGAGRELNLPPMGKLRVNRVEEKANGKVIVCKLRQGQAGPKAKADKDEDEADNALADTEE